MSKNDKKRNLAAVNSNPIVNMMTVKTYVSGHPTFECNTDPLGALHLIGIALATVANALVEERQRMAKKAQADPVDKPRNYLGPREG